LGLKGLGSGGRLHEAVRQGAGGSGFKGLGFQLPVCGGVDCRKQGVKKVGRGWWALRMVPLVGVGAETRYPRPANPFPKR
jgi:hypothetical protein